MTTLAADLARADFPWRYTYVSGPELASLYGALVAYSGRWQMPWSGTLESTPEPWAREATMALALDDGPHSSAWRTGYCYEALVDAFIEPERLRARRRHGATLAQAPIDAWRTPERLSAIADRLKYQGIRTLADVRQRPHEFRLAIRSAVSECSLFRPQSAKALYDVLADGPVLDPCAGWGCRALGALASKKVTSYIGFDPNVGLKAGHDAMLRFFKASSGHGGAGGSFDTKSIQVIYEPFETGAIKYGVAPGSMSLVLTSPPFFDLEVYGTAGASAGQSFTGQSFEAWASNWLTRFVALSALALRPGGFLAIHLNDSPGAPSVRALHDAVAAAGSMTKKSPIAILGPKGQARPVWLWQKTS